MGDVLHAMPAVAALRNSFPEAEIGWAIERRWVPLLRSDSGSVAMTGGRPLVDRIHEVDTRGWRKRIASPQIWREVKSAFAEIHSEKYSVAIDIQGALKSAFIARFSGADRIFGFSAPRESAATVFYSKSYSVAGPHVIEMNLQLVSNALSLDSSASAGNFDLPRTPEQEAWSDGKLSELGISRFCIMTPGSGWGAKCWPAERYAEVARRLGVNGICSLVNHGPGEESLAKSVAEQSGGAAVPLGCDLAQLIALTRRAVLFIGGDTGPMHLAAALKVPVVALFGPTDPSRNGPFGTPAVILRSEKSKTSYSHVNTADPGLQSITSDEVIQAASTLLNEKIR